MVSSASYSVDIVVSSLDRRFIQALAFKKRMPRPILDIRHATVYRGDTCVFTDFSLFLQEGEHVAILGPNGAGKSTFLKLLAGEVHPVPHDETYIRLFVEERWNVWDVRKGLGMVSHDLQHQYMER